MATVDNTFSKKRLANRAANRAANNKLLLNQSSLGRTIRDTAIARELFDPDDIPGVDPDLNTKDPVSAFDKLLEGTGREGSLGRIRRNFQKLAKNPQFNDNSPEEIIDFLFKKEDKRFARLEAARPKGKGILESAGNAFEEGVKAPFSPTSLAVSSASAAVGSTVAGITAAKAAKELSRLENLNKVARLRGKPTFPIPSGLRAASKGIPTALTRGNLAARVATGAVSPTVRQTVVVNKVLRKTGAFFAEKFAERLGKSGALAVSGSVLGPVGAAATTAAATLFTVTSIFETGAVVADTLIREKFPSFAEDNPNLMLALGFVGGLSATVAGGSLSKAVARVAARESEKQLIKKTIKEPSKQVLELAKVQLRLQADIFQKGGLLDEIEKAAKRKGGLRNAAGQTFTFKGADAGNFKVATQQARQEQKVRAATNKARPKRDQEEAVTAFKKNAQIDVAQRIKRLQTGQFVPKRTKLPGQDEFADLDRIIKISKGRNLPVRLAPEIREAANAPKQLKEGIRISVKILEQGAVQDARDAVKGLLPAAPSIKQIARFKPVTTFNLLTGRPEPKLLKGRAGEVLLARGGGIKVREGVVIPLQTAFSFINTIKKIIGFKKPSELKSFRRNDIRKDRLRKLDLAAQRFGLSKNDTGELIRKIAFTEKALKRASVLQKETQDLVKKESAKSKKRGAKSKKSGAKRSKNVSVTVRPKGEKITVKSAGDVIDGGTAATHERVKLLQGDSLTESQKAELNKLFTEQVEQGFSQEVASKVVLDAAKKLKKVLGQTKTSPTFKNLLEQRSAQEAGRAAKEFPIDNEEVLGAAKQMDEALEKGAKKLGKDVDELTPEEQIDILSRPGPGGKSLLGIATTAVVLGSLLNPEQSEAGVAQKVFQHIGKALGGKGEAETIANVYKIANKGKLSAKEQVKQSLDEIVKSDPELIANSDEAARRIIAGAKFIGMEIDGSLVKNERVGAIKRTLGSVFGNLRAMGKDGKLVAQLFEAVDDYTEIANARVMKAINDHLPLSNQEGVFRQAKFSKFEGKVVHDLLVGIKDNGQRRLVETAAGLRNVLDDMFTEAEKAGVTLVGRRKNYVPQILKKDFLLDEVNRMKLINHLLKGNAHVKPLVKNVDDAVAIVNRMAVDRFANIFEGAIPKTNLGRLELPRRIDFTGTDFYVGSDGKGLLEALALYTEQVNRRIVSARVLGKDNEKLTPLVKRLIEQGQSQRYLNTAMQVLQGKKPEHFKAPQVFNSTQNFLRGTEAISDLGFAGASQFAQIAFLSSKVGFLNTFKGIAKAAFSAETRAQTRASAAVSPHLQRYLVDAFGGGVSKFQRGTVTWAMKMYGIIPVDRMLRHISAAAGGEYVEQLTRDLVKQGIRTTKESKLVQRQLRELGLIPNQVIKQGGKLTDEQLLVAMKRVSDQTQFRSRPGDLPLFFGSDYAKFAVQFKNFTAQSGSAINRLMIQEWKKGNKAPLLRMAGVSPLIGMGVFELRELLAEIAGQTFDEPGKFFKKLRDRKRDLLKPGTISTQPIDFLGGTSIAKTLNDALYVMSLGLYMDVSQDVLGKFGPGEVSLGPSGSRVAKMLRAMFKTIDERDFDHMEKELRKLTPLGLNRKF